MAVQIRSAIPRLHEKNFKTIGLISDTHVPTRAREVPKEVYNIFENTDYIVHAGDLVNMSVIDDLEQLAPVLAVRGNMDGPDISGKLPRLACFRIFDWKIGVIHNPGTLFGMTRMREIARTNNFNVLVYGHTHSPIVKWEANTLYINPGSPTNPATPFSNKPSVALLKVTKENVAPEIVQI
jgi:putative phosphoesterase